MKWNTKNWMLLYYTRHWPIQLKELRFWDFTACKKHLSWHGRALKSVVPLLNDTINAPFSSIFYHFSILWLSDSCNMQIWYFLHTFMLHNIAGQIFLVDFHFRPQLDKWGQYESCHKIHYLVNYVINMYYLQCFNELDFFGQQQLIIKLGMNPLQNIGNWIFI